MIDYVLLSVALISKRVSCRSKRIFCPRWKCSIERRQKANPNPEARGVLVEALAPQISHLVHETTLYSHFGFRYNHRAFNCNGMVVSAQG